MNRLKGGVDHSVKYRLKALESNPFDPELRERVDVTIKISASQYLLDISSLDDYKWEEKYGFKKNFVEYIRKKSNFWGGLKKLRRIQYSSS